jgi:GxxExxY protein
MGDEGIDVMPEGKLTEIILGCCFDVMNELGTGFLEAVYKNAFVVALRQKGVQVSQEIPFEICFRGETVGRYIADLLVEKEIIVEFKCCKALLPEHQAQVINYLKATGLSVGLLVNFGQYRLEYKRLHG